MRFGGTVKKLPFSAAILVGNYSTPSSALVGEVTPGKECQATTAAQACRVVVMAIEGPQLINGRAGIKILFG